MKSYISRKFAAATRMMETTLVLRPSAPAIDPKAMSRLLEMSPNQLQTELDLTRAGKNCGDQAGVCNRAAVGRVQACVLDRRREVGVIEDVEEFRAELHPQRLRHPYVAKQRGVEIHQSRPDQNVPSRVAEAGDRIRESKTLGLDVVRGIAGIYVRAAAPGALRHVRAVKGGTGLHSNGIAADLRRKWRPGSGSEVSAPLPAIHDPAQRRISRPQLGHLPNIVQCKRVPDVEVGKTAAPLRIEK